MASRAARASKPSRASRAATPSAVKWKRKTRASQRGDPLRAQLYRLESEVLGADISAPETQRKLTEIRRLESEIVKRRQTAKK